MGLFDGTPWEHEIRCERCGKAAAECRCPPEPKPSRVKLAPEKQTARLQTENRKKGKSVTVVRGLDPAENDFADLLTRLKTTCGAGGTVKDDTLEIQGEHLERVRTLLASLGYKVKG